MNLVKQYKNVSKDVKKYQLKADIFYLNNLIK